MPMRLHANENVPGPAVTALRDRGHDVTWAAETAPGLNDPAVISRAVRDARLLITFDKDFGELVFHQGVKASCGVVLFRITTSSPEHAAEVVVRELERHAADLPGHFTVVSDRRVRVVPLPHASAE